MNDPREAQLLISRDDPPVGFERSDGQADSSYRCYIREPRSTKVRNRLERSLRARALCAETVYDLSLIAEPLRELAIQLLCQGVGHAPAESHIERMRKTNLVRPGVLA